MNLQNNTFMMELEQEEILDFLESLDEYERMEKEKDEQENTGT